MPGLKNRIYQAQVRGVEGTLVINFTSSTVTGLEIKRRLRAESLVPDLPYFSITANAQYLFDNTVLTATGGSYPTISVHMVVP